MIDRSHRLLLARPARKLGISRGNVYYLPKPVSAADLAIMRRMDELHLEFPFADSRMLRDLLPQEGIEIGRQHVATLMKKITIEAIYRRPNKSKPAPAVVDWFSRKVLAWRVSITMEADFCVEALEEALARFGKPDIFNTDQGSQFTSMAFTSVLLREEIAISMDGRGAWRDNVVVERLWRSVKYEEVYLRAYATVSVGRGSIGRYLSCYNSRRPHSSLAAKMPDQAYFDNLPLPMAA
jgi:putative transposase